MTIDMTGQMNPQIRAEQWQNRRVFFVTPQVLEKDIQAGTKSEYSVDSVLAFFLHLLQ
jgi:ERCC4-related helicase